MQRARKWQAVLAISFLLVTSSVRGISEVPASERRTLLDLIEQVAGDSSISSSRESGRVVSRRYNVGVAQSAEHANRRLSSRERSAASPRSSSKRPTEIFSRDSTLKEKFLNHFTAHSPYLTGKPAEHTRLLIPWEHLDMTSSDGADTRPSPQFLEAHIEVIHKPGKDPGRTQDPVLTTDPLPCAGPVWSVPAQYAPGDISGIEDTATQAQWFSDFKV
ncbi:ALK and LTK ligand 1 isoform X2 [Hyperolius riggenbachi]